VILRLRPAAAATLVALAASLTGTAVLTTAPAHAATTNFEIINKASGKCLDAENSPSHGRTPATNGDPVQLWTCLGTPNQMWHVKQTRVVGFPLEIINNASGKCLDAVNIGPSYVVNPFVNGDHVQLYSCNGRPNQDWSDILNSSSSKPQPVYGGGGYETPGMVYHGLDAENSPSHGWTPATNGDPVQMWKENGTSNQLWFIR
jgi:Ricin-type beta-trefoil lectin domain